MSEQNEQQAWEVFEASTQPAREVFEAAIENLEKGGKTE